MDILQFLNSEDVRKHLKEIDYNFSPLEMAYIVYHSKSHTLLQKQVAWREIAEKYPAELYYRKGIFKKQPLSNLLKKYINLQNDLIDELKKEESAVWEFCFKTDESNDWQRYLYGHVGEIPYFSSFDKCFNYAFTELAKNHYSVYGNPIKVRFIKTYLDSERRITVDLDMQKTPLYVYAEGLDEEDSLLQNLFYYTWINIPTPFKRGDIVKCFDVNDGEDDIFVLSEICTWGREELKQNGFHNGNYRGRDSRDFALVEVGLNSLKREGDEECMSFSGYYYNGGDIDYCESDNYLDLEYYRGEQDNDTRFLKVFSYYLKGEVDIDALLKFYKYFTLKNNVEFARYEADFPALNNEGLCLRDLLNEKQTK